MSATEPEPPSRSAHPQRRVVVAACFLAVAVLVALLARVAGAASSPGTHSVGLGFASFDRAAAARTTLGHLQTSLRDGDEAGFLAAFADDAAAQTAGRDLFHNLTALGATAAFGVSLASAHTDAGGTAQPLSAGWDADVDVTWAMPAVDRHSVTSGVEFWLTGGPGDAVVQDVAAQESARAPIWLMGRLSVLTDPNAVTAAAGATVARRVQARLVTAQHDVRAILPDWHGTLVAFVPPTQQDFEALVNQPPGEYDSIAAVTAPISTAPKSPQMIAVNPSVLGRLTPVALHEVITHEATHFATGAALSPAPEWLEEGFADYVGITAAGVPPAQVERSAAADVRRGGVPTTLPTRTDFLDNTTRQGTAYSLSYVAVRLLARDYGMTRVTGFYQDMIADPGRLEALLHHDLGTTLPALTARYRDSLRRLADGG